LPTLKGSFDWLRDDEKSARKAVHRQETRRAAWQIAQNVLAKK
jgi:hypothetical protein